MLTVKEETPRQDEVKALLEESEAFAVALYPPESRHMIDVDALAAPRVTFFVARLDGRAVGCGALVLGIEGKAEIKRMFVRQQARGHGVGRGVLEAIEGAARQYGVQKIRLETGTGNSAALSLYRSFGYRDRGPFGAYKPDRYTIFMEKKFAPA